MCLYTSYDAKIADKDIICYKLVTTASKLSDYKNLLKSDDILKIKISQYNYTKHPIFSTTDILEGPIYIENKQIYICSNLETQFIKKYLSLDNLLLINKNFIKLNTNNYKYLYNIKLFNHYNLSFIYINNNNILKTNPKYITFYRQFEITLNTTYTSELEVKHKSYYFIEKGLHSYKYAKDCKTYKNKNINTHIVKCVIPKGSTYYEGYFNECKSYASDTLQYLKIIK